VNSQPLANEEVEEKLREACTMPPLRENEASNLAELGIESRFSTTTLTKHLFTRPVFRHSIILKVCYI